MVILGLLTEQMMRSPQSESDSSLPNIFCVRPTSSQIQTHQFKVSKIWATASLKLEVRTQFAQFCRPSALKTQHVRQNTNTHHKGTISFYWQGIHACEHVLAQHGLKVHSNIVSCPSDQSRKNSGALIWGQATDEEMQLFHNPRLSAC